MMLVCTLCGGIPAFGQSITDFSPKYGAIGDTNIISGSSFTAGSVVKFGGVTATIRTVTDTSHITAKVPAGATTGFISVDTATSTNVYTIIGTGPLITDFSPAAGASGDPSPVVINGVHFSGVSAVKFGGVSALNGQFGANADGTQITAFIPPGAVTGPISVTTPTGTSNSPSSFTVIGAGPYISSFSPNAGGQNTTVTLNGAHFSNVTNVSFNGITGRNLGVLADTMLQVDTPTNVTTGPITAMAPAGSYTTSNYFYAPPAITGFSPAAGRAGTNVIVTGKNLLGTSVLQIGSLGVPFVVNSNTQITVTLPVGALTGQILLVAPGGGAQTSSNFVVQPLISSFVPNFGRPGTNVTVAGQNLFGATNVSFNGANVTPTGISYGQLSALVPAAASTGPITVMTTNGSHTSSALFYLPPRIFSFTPTNAPAGATVTISGTNFLDASDVSFNGTVASFTPPTNNSTIYAVVPNGVTTGPISVTTPGGSTNSNDAFYGPPIISNFTPGSGLPGTNVTITGTNFLNVSSVLFNGLASTFVVTNTGLIGAVVPAGASTGPIKIITPGGTNASASNFVLNYTSDLRLTLTDSPDPVTVGNNVTYFITVTNAGLFAAPNLRLTNTLPVGATLVSAGTTLPGSLTSGGGLVTLALGSLAVGASGNVTIVVTPTSVGTLSDQASVRSDYLDSNMSNNDVTATTAVDAAAARLSISNVPPNQVRVSWPASLTNYGLEFRPTFGAADFWSNSAASPVIVGPENVVTETRINPTRFYRLHRLP